MSEPSKAMHSDNLSQRTRYDHLSNPPVNCNQAPEVLKAIDYFQLITTKTVQAEAPTSLEKIPRSLKIKRTCRIRIAKSLSGPTRVELHVHRRSARQCHRRTAD